MNRIKRRSGAVLLLVAAAAALMGIFLFRLWRDGGDWAGSRVNGGFITAGRVRRGTVTDRNGLPLLTISDGKWTYAEDKSVRRAALHIVGDRDGFIGTGAARQYTEELLGYGRINGLYDLAGDGGTVALSIDAGVCSAALSALDGRRGAVAVMDVATGELICEVSSPVFDPADPPSSVDDGSGVYLNRFLSSTYTPGSIYKLVTAAAAYENIGDILTRDFVCSGSAEFSGGTVTCAKKHGELKFEDALAVSCNCAFASLAVELGAERMAEYAKAYGLTEKGSVDGIVTAAGNYSIADSEIDLAWSGAGQYKDTVNPAAMLRFAAAIANGGLAPDMTQLSGGGGGSTRIMRADTAAKIRDMMDYCVSLTYNDERFPGLDVYAKSGTAEVGGGRKPNAWFVGFAKADNRTLAFAVVIEEGGWGGTEAANAANKVLQVAFFGV